MNKCGSRIRALIRERDRLAELETARALGVSVGTVKSQTSKGMAMLQKALREEADEPTGSEEETVRLRFPVPWSRMLVSALATMAVAGAVSIAAWQLTERIPVSAAPQAGQPAVRLAIPPPSSSARNSAAPGGAAAASTSNPGSSSVPVAATGAPGPQSYPYWAQNDVKVRVERTLRDLDVTVRVKRTDRVSPAGSWLSLPANDFRASTETSGDAIVYRWTLLPGRTVRPGSYVLAAQYDRGADHDRSGDTFTLRSGLVTITGHF
jgi:hypothetical protein